MMEERDREGAGHVPFVLVGRLDSPVMTERPIHVDGLLLAIRERLEGGASVGTPFGALSRRGGAFQASAAFLAGPSLAPVSVTHHATSRSLRFTGQSDDRDIVADGRERVVSQMNLRLRGHVPRHVTVEGATAAYWQCLGDPDRVLALARRIECVGGRRNARYGEVVEWEVLPCRDGLDRREVGRTSGGRVLRNLAADDVDGVPDGARPERGRIEPSYKDVEGRIDVVVPTLRSMLGSHAEARALFGF